MDTETRSSLIPPVVGITIGDAAGIGPEISLKAVADTELLEHCQPVLIGDFDMLKRLTRTMGLGVELVAADEIERKPGSVPVVDMGNLPGSFLQGVDDPVTGRASAECIETAVRLCEEGSISAIATAPISKKAIALAGYDYPGHTEFLAALTETEDVAMSFFAGNLRVVLLSTHVSLRQAIELVVRRNIVDLVRFANHHLGDLLDRKVRFAVAGLNPHASEHGMFGDEEAREIGPAIEECRDRFGIDVSGPYSPDTIFLRGHSGEFDAVIACYHDQATIAVKSLSFGASVNVTLGLPIIRTSVDHGTAFDIAGKGIADASSMKAAIRLAGELAAVRRHEQR